MIVAFINTPSWLYALPSMSADPRIAGAASVVVGDVNGDGLDDLIVAVDGNPMVVRTYNGLPTSGFVANASFTLSVSDAVARSVVYVGDVNGDGYGDIAYTGFEQQELYSIISRIVVKFSYGHGTLPFSTGTRLTETFDSLMQSITLQALGDLNGDGKSDILINITEQFFSPTPIVSRRIYWGNSTFPATASTVNNTFFPSAIPSTATLKQVAPMGHFTSNDHDDLLMEVSYDTSTPCSVNWFITPIESYYRTTSWVVYNAKQNIKSIVYTHHVCVNPYYPEDFGNNAFIKSTVLDSNGDGVKDLALSFAGGIQLYTGSESGGVLSILFNSEVAYESQSLSDMVFIGDTNGDGYDDIGLLFYNASFDNDSFNWVYSSQFKIVYGSSAGFSPERARLIKEKDGANSIAVSFLNDINGDGYSDLRVDGDVYYGGSSGVSLIKGNVVQAASSIAGYGYAGGAAGDVNGDGYGDVMVSAPAYSNGHNQEGAVYVYHGSSSGVSNTPSLVLESNMVGAQFGYAVSFVGDVNADGYGDVAVGLPYAKREGSTAEEGQVWILYGSSTGLSASNKKVIKPHIPSLHFGSAVSFAADVNGDGYHDVVVGAFDHDSEKHGAAFVFTGSPQGVSRRPLWWKVGSQPFEQLGSSVSSAGDFNADGYADIMVGSPFTEASSPGKAQVFQGHSRGVSFTAAWISTGEQNSDSYGASVSGAGDVNGDGYSDVMVGAPRWGGASQKGKIFVYHGSAGGLSSSAVYTFEGASNNHRVGSYVSQAKDLDGNGYGDVYVGAPGFLGKGAFVLYGSQSGLLTNTLQHLQNDSATATLKASFAGDVNADGCADLMVLNQTNKKMELFFGNTYDLKGFLPSSQRIGVKKNGSFVCALCVVGDQGSFEVVSSSPNKKWYASRGQLEVETKNLNTPFDGTTNIAKPTTFSLLTNTLTTNVTNLSGRTLKWRMRYVYESYEKKYPQKSPWIYGENLKINNTSQMISDDSDVSVVVYEGASVVIPKSLNRNASPYLIMNTQHGSLSRDSNNVIFYQHDGSETTSDEFMFVLSDGFASSMAIRADVRVVLVNDAPVAVSDTASVNEAGTVSVPVLSNDTDAENNLLSVDAVTRSPLHGRAVVQDGMVVYSHDGTETTTDSFQYSVSDGAGGVSTGSVSVNITPVNDAPVAVSDTASVNEAGTVSIRVLSNDTDAENNLLSVAAVTRSPLHGTAVVQNGTVVYSHDGTETTTDSFQYSVSDGAGGVSTASVSVNITPVNDPPLAMQDTVTVDEGGFVVVDVVLNDQDPDSFDFDIELSNGELQSPQHGRVSVENGKVVYIHNGDEDNTSDTFEYRIFDDRNLSSKAQVRIEINPVNDAPVLHGADPLSGAVQYQPYVITFEYLASHVQQSDPERNALFYVIEDIYNGDFKYSGGAVVFGSTIFKPGESIVWTPVSKEVGLLNVLKLKAYDGDRYSVQSLVLQVQVGPGSQPKIKSKSGCAAFDASNGWMLCLCAAVVTVRTLRRRNTNLFSVFLSKCFF